MLTFRLSITFNKAVSWYHGLQCHNICPNSGYTQWEFAAELGPQYGFSSSFIWLHVKEGTEGATD